MRSIVDFPPRNRKYSAHSFSDIFGNNIISVVRPIFEAMLADRDNTFTVSFHTHRVHGHGPFTSTKRLAFFDLGLSLLDDWRLISNTKTATYLNREIEITSKIHRFHVILRKAN